jgi:hypothetical protein
VRFIGGGALHAGEDERLLDVDLAQQAVEHAVLVLGVVGDQGVLGDVGLGLLAARDLDALGVARDAVREVADHAVQRGGEEDGLPLLRRAREDRVDLFLEAHVEHSVGFVEHQELDAAELDAAAVHVVLEAAGRGDDDVDGLAYLHQLLAERHAADEARGEQALPAAVAVRRLLDLHRELARGCEHQHARADARKRGRRAQALQAGKHEGGGLAAAGLG